jgi:hypothetical protein
MSETSNDNKFIVNPEIFGNSQFCIQMGKTPIVFSLPEREHALFLALGMALAEIQSFETGIAFLLSSIANEAGHKVEEGYFDKLMQEYGSKTLGLLVKHFREVVRDEEISSLLEEVKNKRNYIVHNILREYGWPMMSDEVYVKAIEEITQITQKIRDAERIIVPYLREEKILKIILMSIDVKTGEVSSF